MEKSLVRELCALETAISSQAQFFLRGGFNPEWIRVIEEGELALKEENLILERVGIANFIKPDNAGSEGCRSILHHDCDVAVAILMKSRAFDQCFLNNNPTSGTFGKIHPVTPEGIGHVNLFGIDDLFGFDDLFGINRTDGPDAYADKAEVEALSLLGTAICTDLRCRSNNGAEKNQHYRDAGEQDGFEQLFHEFFSFAKKELYACSADFFSDPLGLHLSHL